MLIFKQKNENESIKIQFTNILLLYTVFKMNFLFNFDSKISRKSFTFMKNTDNFVTVFNLY